MKNIYVLESNAFKMLTLHFGSESKENIKKSMQYKNNYIKK